MKNIDDDPQLLRSVRRYHEGEINEDQLEWVLKERGYSKEEISAAKADFHWIHVHTPKIIKKYLVPACVVMLLILIAIHTAWNSRHGSRTNPTSNTSSDQRDPYPK